MKRDLINFSKKITNGISKPEEKFIMDMLFGISKSSSTLISEISRGLKEDIKLGYTIERLCNHLSSFSNEKAIMTNYSIITKSIDEANLIYEQFKDRYKKISVIDIDTKKYYTELVVTPAYGAKGLEFDAVIIVNNFSYDSYLYYVAVTRAQHELVVYE